MEVTAEEEINREAAKATRYICSYILYHLHIDNYHGNVFNLNSFSYSQFVMIAHKCLFTFMSKVYHQPSSFLLFHIS